MSFRIDDILKRETKPDSSNDREQSPSCKNTIIFAENNRNQNKNDSILEYMLRNKCYYKKVEEPVFNKCYECYNRIRSNPVASNLDFNKSFSCRCEKSFGSISIPHPFLWIRQYVPRRKGGQIRFTTKQTQELEKRFRIHKYLTADNRKQLADLLDLSDRQVKTWFQNRRAKWRKNQNEIQRNKIDNCSYN